MYSRSTLLVEGSSGDDWITVETFEGRLWVTAAYQDDIATVSSASLPGACEQDEDDESVVSCRLPDKVQVRTLGGDDTVGAVSEHDHEPLPSRTAATAPVTSSTATTRSTATPTARSSPPRSTATRQ